MNCMICHASNWMQKKTLGFIQTMLEHYENTIYDEDIFKPLDFVGAEELLHSLIDKKLPKSKKAEIVRAIDDDHVEEILKSLWRKPQFRTVLKKDILPEMFEQAKSVPWGVGGEDDLFHQKVIELQHTLKLTDQEIDILLISLAMNEHIFGDPMRGSQSRCTQQLVMMSGCLNLKEKDVLNILSPKNSLRRFECLDEDLDINNSLMPFLSGLTDEPLINNYFSRDTEETLPWSDFADLAKTHGNILKRMLTASEKPVNILLYGAPGTGKTSFARTLAKEINRTCYTIAQKARFSRQEATSSPKFRFGALQVCDSQVLPEQSIIVVDESDDMLRGRNSFGGMFMLFGDEGVSSTGDKGLLNAVLDTMKTSTIWITNTPASALDESSRRRFDYSICFEPLNDEQRARIWKNNIARLKMGRLINAQQVANFSSLYPVSAGGITQTLENLERMHPKKAEVPRLVEQLMKPHCELLGIKLADDKLLPSKDYSLEGLNIHGDVKLERIVEAIRAFQRRKGALDPDRPRMNLLLSGAPGTGKTEFVKYLGDILETKVNVKMASDLLGMYVGQTEKNIAYAFREAKQEHAILFLDEIDGLVQTRTNAQHSWEVSQVNELLYQMENFDGVMIGATNFIQNLDQAIMRRFTFKLQFNFLDDNGKRLFFERMFKSPLTDAEKLRLNEIPNLAPGDFRTVRQSFFYYGGDVTNAQRLDALEQESAAKDGGSFVVKRKVGF